MEDIPLSCLIAGGFTNYTRLHEKKTCVSDLSYLSSQRQFSDAKAQPIFIYNRLHRP